MTPLFHVDAFSAVPFAGNPAAVCLLDTPRDAAWMQKVAREMNVSETAFVIGSDRPEADDRPEACPTPDRPEACPTPDRPEACPTPDRPEARPTRDRPEACPTPDRPEACPTLDRPEACPTSDGRGDNITCRTGVSPVARGVSPLAPGVSPVAPGVSPVAPGVSPVAPGVSPVAAADFDLRWFTPQVEVDLCGHATLASAHVLWETGRVAADAPVRFRTRSGVLIARRRDVWIELDFPGTPVEASPVPADYLAALGITETLFVGKAGPRHIIQVPSEAVVRALAPDFARLRALPGRGIAVTARAESGPYDVVSRYFAPWVGVNEDPVTGSVHCGLAVFWAPRLGRREMLAYQASRRGGVLRLRLEGERVVLGGQAVTIAAGRLAV